MKVMKKSLLLFLFLVSPVLAQDFNYFQGMQDEGFAELGSSMNAFQQHLMKSLDYTANWGTVGFIRKSVANIREFDTNTGVNRIVIATSRRWMEGVLRETQRDLDFSVKADNKGFFTIRLPSGVVGYTRDGRFEIDSRNRLVVIGGGFPVLGENGEINLPLNTDISVSRSGVIFSDGTPIDRMKIAVFDDYEDMRNLLSANGVLFVLVKPINLREGPEHYSVIQGWVMESNSYKSNDGATYKNAFNYTINGLQTMFDAQRNMTSALTAD